MLLRIAIYHMFLAQAIAGAIFEDSEEPVELGKVADSSTLRLRRLSRSPVSSCPASSCVCRSGNPSMMSCPASNGRIAIENVNIDDVAATMDGPDSCAQAPYEIRIQHSGIKTLESLANITSCKVESVYFSENPSLIVKDATTPLSVTTLTLEGTALKDFESYSISMKKLVIINLSVEMNSFSSVQSGVSNVYSIKALSARGELMDFPSFEKSRSLETIVFSNVKSKKGTSLLPDRFLTSASSLKSLSIDSSLDVVLPQGFLSSLSAKSSNQLDLVIDIWNVQQTSLDVSSINVLKTLNSMTMQQTVLQDAFKDNGDCNDLCRKNNKKVDCSSLSNTEKRNCGICVKNKISVNKLNDELKHKCQLSDPETIYGHPALPPGTTAAHPEWMTTWVDYVEGINLGNDYDLIPYNLCSRKFPMLWPLCTLIVKFLTSP